MGIAMFAAFVALGLYFSQAAKHESPVKEAEAIPKEWYDPKPVRRIRGKLEFEGMACTTCHSEPLEGNPKDKGQFHETIKLEHAAQKRNRFCFNCHNNKNFDSFAGAGGERIAYKDVAELCSKCHGPIYRDWKAGSHGRRSGYWDLKQGKREVLQCIACHDPHSPMFKPMKPAGPPRRLHEIPHEPKGGHPDEH